MLCMRLGNTKFDGTQLVSNTNYIINSIKSILLRTQNSDNDMIVRILQYSIRDDLSFG